MIGVVLCAASYLVEQQAHAVAAVVAARGGVAVRAADGTTYQAELGTLLAPGARVTVPAGSSAMLVYFAGGVRERVKPSKEVTIGKDGGAPADAVERLKPVPATVAPILRGLRTVPGRRSGLTVARSEVPPGGAPAVTPIDDATVLTDRPALSWPSSANAKSYRVRMTVDGSGRVVWEANAPGPRLAYPEAKPPLTRLRRYIWKVSDDSGKPVAEGHFFVASEIRARAAADLAALASADDPVDVLTAALGYEALGALDNALAAYERLAKLNPDERAYSYALADLYNLAGRLEEAKAARASALRGD
jgi:hypothetical protein